MKINPYPCFNGQCEAAFKFYERCLGGKIVAMMRYADSPMVEDVPPEWRDKIMHARLVAGDNVLMGSDAFSGCYEKAQGISISINVDTPEEADRIFQALSEKATIRMPIEETFWAVRFGTLTDQFGIPWMINCEKAN